MTLEVGTFDGLGSSLSSLKLFGCGLTSVEAGSFDGFDCNSVVEFTYNVKGGEEYDGFELRRWGVWGGG